MSPDPFLLEEERCLEFEAIDRGVQRYREFRERNAGRGFPEQKLAALAIDALVDYLTELRRQINEQEILAARGMKAWGPVVMFFKPEMLAACALVTTIHVIVRQHSR